MAPERIHPALWRADGLGRAPTAGWPTGFAALDAELPGGGWPVGALTELLLPHPGVGEWRLLAPALAALQGSPALAALQGSPALAALQGSPALAALQGPAAAPRRSGRAGGGDGPCQLLLFDPPAQPCPWTLAALGLDLTRLLVVRGQPGRRVPAVDTLWALEQALASGQVGALLAWLPPRLPADALRRLQLAAQAHPGPAFLLRESAAAANPSAAPLRLALAPGPAELPDGLQLRILKRRGPAQAAPLQLALPPVLGDGARQRVQQRLRQRIQQRAGQPACLAAQGADATARAVDADAAAWPPGADALAWPPGADAASWPPGADTASWPLGADTASWPPGAYPAACAPGARASTLIPPTARPSAGAA